MPPTARLLPLLIALACKGPPTPEVLPGPALPACTAAGFGDGLAIDVSPDGSLVAVAGDGGLVQLYRASDGMPLGRSFDATRPSGYPITRVRFSPDGRMLTAADCCRALTLWQVDGTVLRQLDDQHAPVALSVEGLMVARGEPAWTLVVSRVADGAEVARAEARGAQVDLAVLSDGQGFRSFGGDGTIQTWRFDGKPAGPPVKVAPTALQAGLLSRDGARYAQWNDQGTIIVGDAATGAVITTVTLDMGKPVAGAFGTEGRFFGVIDAGRLFSITAGATAPTWHGSVSTLRPAVAVLPDGQTLFAADLDSRLYRWQLAEPFMQRMVSFQMNATVLVAPGPDPDTVISVDERSAALRSPSTGAPIAIDDQAIAADPGSVIIAADRSRDARVVVAAQSDAVHVWRVTPDRQLGRVRSMTTAGVLSVAVAPDGGVVAAATKAGVVKRWNVDGGDPLPDLPHGPGVSGLLFSPDGKTLLSTSYDVAAKLATGKLWDLATGATMAERRSAGWPLAFSPDGALLVVHVGEETVLETREGTRVRALEGRLPRSGPAAFSPDGSLVAAGGDDRVRVWRVADGKLMHAPAMTGPWVSTLAFSADGHTLWGGGREGTIRSWCLPADASVAAP